MTETTDRREDCLADATRRLALMSGEAANARRQAEAHGGTAWWGLVERLDARVEFWRGRIAHLEARRAA